MTISPLIYSYASKINLSTSSKPQPSRTYQQEDTIQKKIDKSLLAKDKITHFFLTIPIIKYLTQMLWKKHVSSALARKSFFERFEYLSSLSIPSSESGLKKYLAAQFEIEFEHLNKFPYSPAKSQGISCIKIPSAIKDDEKLYVCCLEKLKGAILKIIEESPDSAIDIGIPKPHLPGKIEGSKDFLEALMLISREKGSMILKVKKHMDESVTDIFMRNGTPFWIPFTKK